MSILKPLAISLGLVAMMAVTFDASAQSLRVRCETRSDRSKASVDGNNLASGSYKAVLISGPNRADSPYDQTFGDEIEFDFDSNRNDINQGATPISQNFIVRNRVTGALLDVNGNVVVKQKAVCERK